MLINVMLKINYDIIKMFCSVEEDSSTESKVELWLNGRGLLASTLLCTLAQLWGAALLCVYSELYHPFWLLSCLQLGSYQPQRWGFFHWLLLKEKNRKNLEEKSHAGYTSHVKINQEGKKKEKLFVVQIYTEVVVFSFSSFLNWLESSLRH